MMTGDEAMKIYREVVLGKQPATPDTPEAAQLRQQVTAEVQQARASGEQFVWHAPSE
jgi:hypothetical protein